MSNLINLNTHTIEILTKKNMSHLIAFNLNNEAIPVNGVNVSHLNTPEPIIKVVTSLITVPQNEQEIYYKQNSQKQDVVLTNTLANGSTYNFNSIKDLTSLTPIKVNSIIQSLYDLVVRKFQFGSLENAKSVTQNHLFLLQLESSYTNKTAGLAQKTILLDDCIDLSTGKQFPVTDLDYQKQDGKTQAPKRGSVPVMSEKAIMVKRASQDISTMNRIMSLSPKAVQDFQERVWEVSDYEDLMEYSDFELVDQLPEPTEDELKDLRYTRVFFDLLLKSKLNPDFQPVPFVLKHGDLVEPDEVSLA